MQKQTREATKKTTKKLVSSQYSRIVARKNTVKSTELPKLKVLDEIVECATPMSTPEDVAVTSPLTKPRKRFSDTLDDDFIGSYAAPTKKTAVVQRKTVEKWILENDTALTTRLWLKFDCSSADRNQVTSLNRSLCRQFKERISSMRNYRPAFVEGTTNIKLSAVKDHAVTEKHHRAMLLLKTEHAVDLCECAPIAKSLFQPKMDEVPQLRIKQKFEIAYVIAKEKLAMTKMVAICDLEDRHGVDLGDTYRNNHGATSFIESIAKDQQEQLNYALSKVKFFSIQADASNNTENAENKFFLVL